MEYVYLKAATCTAVATVRPPRRVPRGLTDEAAPEFAPRLVEIPRTILIKICVAAHGCRLSLYALIYIYYLTWVSMGRPQPSLDDCVRVLLVTLAGSRGRCGPLGSVSGRVLLGGFGWWVTGSQVGGEAFGPLFFAAEKRGRGAKAVGHEGADKEQISGGCSGQRRNVPSVRPLLKTAAQKRLHLSHVAATALGSA